jgi:hypothetical protein
VHKGHMPIMEEFHMANKGCVLYACYLVGRELLENMSTMT